MLAVRHRRAMLWIMAVSVVLIVAQITFGPIIGDDSYSYWLTYQHWHDEGTLGMRTPLYPLLVGCAYFRIGPQFAYAFTMATQCIVFLATIPLFFATANMLFGRSVKAIYAILATCLYAFSPSIWGIATIIQTESFAVSFTGIYLYFVAKLLLGKGKMIDCAALCAAYLLMTFLRPMMVVMILPLAVVALALWRRRKRNLAKGVFAAMAFSAAVVLGYCAVFAHQHGIFTLSAVGLKNQYIDIRLEGQWDLNAISDDEVRHAIEQNFTAPQPISYNWSVVADDEFDALVKQYGYGRVNASLRELTFSQPAEVLRLAARRCHYFLFTSASYPDHGPLAQWYSRLPINSAGVMLIFAVAMAIACCWRTRQRAFFATCVVAMLATLATVIFVSPYEWDRLAVYLLPIEYLAVGYFVMIVGGWAQAKFACAGAGNATDTGAPGSTAHRCR